MKFFTLALLVLSTLALADDGSQGGSCPHHRQSGTAPVDMSVYSLAANVPDALNANPDALKLPELLIYTDKYRLYTMQDVCKRSLELEPKKKAALVVVKTHMCDEGTQVCVKSLSNVSDKANYFVQHYFTTFHSRFWRNSERFETGEKEIRKEWKKQDVNPEIYIIDVRKCELLFRDYAYNEAGIFADDPATAYLALRRLVLGSDKVRKLLEIPKEDDAGELAFEKEEIARRLKKYPRQSKQTVIRQADEQGRRYGLYGEDTVRPLP